MAFTYALDDDPRDFVELLPAGGILVAPIAEGPKTASAQTLVRFAPGASGATGARTTHGAVRYVSERRGG